MSPRAHGSETTRRRTVVSDGLDGARASPLSLRRSEERFSMPRSRGEKALLAPLGMTGLATGWAKGTSRIGCGWQKKKGSAKMNRTVSSTFHYVAKHGRCAFPAQNPSHRPRRPKFLLSSTEV